MRDNADPFYLDELTVQLNRLATLYGTDLGAIALAVWMVWKRYPQADMVLIAKTIESPTPNFSETLESLASQSTAP